MGLLTALAASALISAAVSAASARKRGYPSWWGATAVGLGYALGHALIVAPSFPPSDVTDRVAYLALAGAVAGAFRIMEEQGGLGGTGKERNLVKRSVRVSILLALAALAFAAILGPILGRPETPTGGLVLTALALALAGLNVAGLDTPALQVDLAVPLAALAGGSGIVFLLAHSLVLCQLAIVLAAAILASLAGARGRPTSGVVPSAFVVLSALVLESHVYASLPASSALLIASAPAVLRASRFGPLARLGPRARASLASALILLVVAVAAGMALARQSPFLEG